MTLKPKSKNPQTIKISPARTAAFDILTQIEAEKAFSSVLLAVTAEKLAPDDRALCHEITLGVLRRQIYLDAIIGAFTDKKKLDAAIKTILRIGLYQLLYLDKIPAYSAINESVNLVRRAKKTSAKGFVNAVLRRATREKIELSFADNIEKISIETSHPRWLIEKWSGQFGAERTEQLAAANNSIPKISFRLTGKFFSKTVNEQRAILSEIESRYEKSKYVENCFTAAKYEAELFALAETGDIYFQDEGSQLIGQAFDLQKGESYFDVCAAPGSKTTQIAILNSRFQISDSKFQNPDSRLRIPNLMIAGDLHFQRVKFLRENCRRQAVDSVNIIQYDAEKYLPFADESFDCVLLDAPCSGTGTIRHNPEIRYFLSEKDLTELSGKQLAILKNASKLVKRGGRLIYSTCSLETEENEAVCEKFAAQNIDFNLIAPNLPDRFMTAGNFARTFPPKDEMDGFFIAVYERK